MSYECSNCCKEIEDEFLVVQENHVILALFNDVENCFCSQQCVNDFLMIESKLEKNKPMVVYKADNQGAEIFGKVVEKGRHGKLYTLTIREYGVFVVTKEVYNKVRVGDEVRI